MAPWIIEGMSYAVCLFESITLIYLLRALLGAQYKWKYLFVVGALVEAVINSLVRLGNQNVVISIFVSAFFLFIFSVFFCNGSLVKKLFVVFAGEGILLLSDLVTVALITFFFDAKAVELRETSNAYNMIGMVISKTICFSLYAVIQRISRQGEEKMDIRSWLPLLVVPVVSLLSFMMVTEYVLRIEKINGPLVLISTLAIFFMNVLVFFIYQRLQENATAKEKLSLMEQQAEIQAKHYSDIEIAHTNTRAIWHDMNNHMTALSSYVRGGDLENVRAYLEEIGKTVHEMALPSCTGNPVVDALLNEKRLRAQTLGIEMELPVLVLPENAIRPMDLCIVLGNALDNAIEACEKVQGRKFILVRMERYAENLLLVIHNSAVDDGNTELKTTKKDKSNHGFGLGNIKKALEKYDGSFELGLEGDVFKFSAVFPIQNKK